MRNLSKLLLCSLLLCACAIMFWGCFKDHVTKTYTIQRPILKPVAEILSAVNGNATEPVNTAGKLYIKGQYVFVNEVDKGIHVIDNADPAHPVQTAFLNIPGNRDIAIKDNILYADMYANLVALDISDIHKVTVSKLVYNFFVSRRYINGYWSDSTQVVTGWITKDTTVEEGDPGMIVYNSGCANCSFFAAADSKAATPGVAGSMAAMVLKGNYIYAITEPHSVGLIDVTRSAQPVKAGSVYAGFDLQTIYPFQDKLFLGSASGMFMYSISDPAHPTAMGQFSHGRACDPVITDGRYAYVTLHGGTVCGGSSNELNVVDVQDLMKPVLLKTYSLTKPTGLSKDGDILFICDGTSGVRVYNAADPQNLQQLQQISISNPYDIIAGNGHALVVTADGLYQYDYSNINQIKPLGVFSLKRL